MLRRRRRRGGGEAEAQGVLEKEKEKEKEKQKKRGRSTSSWTTFTEDSTFDLKSNRSQEPRNQWIYTIIYIQFINF